MSGITSRLAVTSVLVSSIMLFGCGSSGDGNPGSPAASISYSGSTTPTGVDATNAEDLATTSGEAIQKGANSLSSQVLGVSISSNTDEIGEFSANLAAAMASLSAPNLPTAFTFNTLGGCGGSLTQTIPDDQLSAFNTLSGPVTITTVFSNYCDASVGIQYTIDGQAIFIFNDIGDLNSGFSIQYINVTINDGSGPVTVNMTFACSDAITCTFVSDYVGNDGSTFRVTDISISGDATSGFNGTATFFHSSYGSVSITATSVTYGICGEFPDGGTVDIVGTTGTADIVFNSDCTYTINYNDGAGGTGTINGSFI